MIDAEGVEALSMRKLGLVLNRDPMGVYRHTDSRAALLDSVAELVLENLVIEPALEGDWEAALRAAAESFCSTVLAHPRMVPRLINVPLAGRPAPLSPAGLRWLEGLLEVLAKAGFDETGASSAYRFFTGFLAGHALHEVREHDVDEGVPVAHDSALALGLDLVLIGLRSQLDAITTRQLSK